jgi:hypothetical protein
LCPHRRRPFGDRRALGIVKVACKNRRASAPQRRGLSDNRRVAPSADNHQTFLHGTSFQLTLSSARVPAFPLDPSNL